MGDTPRMRMFAGPNGSGKSELKKYLARDLLGIYLNPDEIEARIRREGSLDFAEYGIPAAASQLVACLQASPLLASAGLNESVGRLRAVDQRVEFADVEVNSYFASVITDYLRHELLSIRASFTFETVMSHPGKVDVLNLARRHGYRTYLYYIATEDPAINVSRVRLRVTTGGHDVPEDRIRSRYQRSLDLLWSAIQSTDRAYVFDNSVEDQHHTWIAEVTDGKRLELRTDSVPAWFIQSVLRHIPDCGQSPETSAC